MGGHSICYVAHVRTKTSQQEVLFRRLGQDSAWVEIVLNRPFKLNAVDLDSIVKIQNEVHRAVQDETVAGFILRSSSEDFSVGGDVLDIHKARIKGDSAFISNYFFTLYSLIKTLYRLKKPLVSINKGRCFGGGMGLFQSARFRIASENAVFAMPEVLIGLSPDAGANYFFKRCPPKVGELLAMSGFRVRSRDAKIAKLTTHNIQSALQEKMLDSILALKAEKNLDEKIQQILIRYEKFSEAQFKPLPSGFSYKKDFIDKFHAAFKASTSDLIEFCEIFHKMSIDPFVKEITGNILKASPLSLEVTRKNILDWEELKTLEDVFEREHILSCNLSFQGDFFEGIQKRVVEKNRDNLEWLSLPEKLQIKNEFVDKFFSKK